jgi:formate dehydrogenase subunit delta
MSGADSELAHLVRGANRIGAFFAAMPDESEASAGIAAHVQRYWAPALRQQIRAHVERGGAGLDPLVLRALQALRG